MESDSLSRKAGPQWRTEPKEEEGGTSREQKEGDRRTAIEGPCHTIKTKAEVGGPGPYHLLPLRLGPGSSPPFTGFASEDLPLSQRLFPPQEVTSDQMGREEKETEGQGQEGWDRLVYQKGEVSDSSH